MKAKSGKTIARKLSRAYWPRPELNESADREAGDRTVDGLTLGQLEAFFKHCTTGPTHVMVKRHLEEDRHVRVSPPRDFRREADALRDVLNRFQLDAIATISTLRDDLQK
jgi:hypothetical protein